MRRRLLAAMVLDVRLQSRSHLYTIGILMAVVMGLLLRFLFPVALTGRALAGFYVIGLGGTTAMVGASMLLLEKGERTLEALRISMITTDDYVLSKALTLTAFAMVESAIVYAIAARGIPTSVPLLVLGTAQLGLFYTFMGLGLAAAYDAITRLLLPTGATVGMLMQLPFLSLLGVGPWWIWYLIPTQASLLLFQGAFEPLATWQWAYTAAMTLVMLPASWAFCRWRFRHHIQLPED